MDNQRDESADLTNFAQLLSSYMCHAFASPLSGLVTGLEILKDAPSDQGIFAIVQDAAEDLRRLLDRLRLAYGSGGRVLSIADALARIQALCEPDQNLSFHHECDHVQGPEGLGQVLLQGFLWLRKKVSREATLRCVSPDNKKIQLTLTPLRTPLSDLEKDIIEGTTKASQERGPREVPLILFLLSAASLGYAVDACTQGEVPHTLVLSLTPSV